MSFLDIRDVRVMYPNGLEALRSVSLSAESGQIVAIIGRSGAGKSTLLRCINGLQRPSSGVITLDGDVITAMDERQLRNAQRRIGFIWQEYNLVGRLSALTNVLSGRLGYCDSLANLVGFFGREHRAVALHNLERVMGEGSLFAPDLAALALAQTGGDLYEAVLLLRGYRSTQPRIGYAEPIGSQHMLTIRRICAAFKDIPGGQILGPTLVPHANAVCMW
jgi:ABC-type Fe3+/spermidine/putrescine transport system ATPase subunit